MSNSFFPSNDDRLLTWATNYRDTIESFASTLGMTPEEVVNEKTNCDAVIDAVRSVSTIKGQLKAAKDHRDDIIATNGGSLRAAISHHKTAPGYTNSIGETLQIVSRSASVDFANYKAKISTELYAGHIRIKFTKKGVEGINLYNRKKGSSNWLFVARITKSPFDHNFALEVNNQPEHWEYRAFGVVSDLEVGIASDIVEIIYGG